MFSRDNSKNESATFFGKSLKSNIIIVSSMSGLFLGALANSLLTTNQSTGGEDAWLIISIFVLLGFFMGCLFKYRSGLKNKQQEIDDS